MGAGIMVTFLATLKHLGEVLATKTASERNAFLASVIGLSGLAACILCFLSDLLYYMNRNITLFAYLMSSVFPVGFLLISTMFHIFTQKVWPVSSASLSQQSNIGGKN
mmetsp:Transcript_37184/g.48931  ORF Transcript_37184/g.48931 Transcript_37184/m.48931 type:complete len:108 (+) Transcript_37184:1002-1325(+)